MSKAAAGAQNFPRGRGEYKSAISEVPLRENMWKHLGAGEEGLCHSSENTYFFGTIEEDSIFSDEVKYSAEQQEAQEQVISWEALRMNIPRNEEKQHCHDS